MTSVLDIRPFTAMLREVSPIRCVGSVQKVVGLTLEAQGLTCEVGELCTVHVEGRPLRAEVVGFREGRTLLMPLGEWHGVRPGTVVEATGSTFSVPMGAPLLGRVIDALGRPIDRLGPIISHERRHILADSSPDPLRRITITQPLSTGVRAIDGPLTVGRGQRMGIFAGSGVGKSTLLGMIARNASSDISVIGLIGERGREVREFIEKDLGEEGLRRSVVVVTTSDQPALLRLKGAWLATAIAEHFREQGADVTLMMDSVTRFAMAQREIGLATGEPPAVKGYTPSVFALLPRLLERSGSSERGTITGFYTVLVEGDDLTEPVTDTVRGTLDGHIVLSRALAGENHYPAIDVLASVSRVMPAVTTPQHRAAAARLREVLSVYQNARDLVNIGAYVAGSNPQIDFALRMLPSVHEFLKQRSNTTTPIDDTVARLATLFPEAN